jgi:hypothetical protein
MAQDAGALTTQDGKPTQHGMLVAWGHFARSPEFTKLLAGIDIRARLNVFAPISSVGSIIGCGNASSMGPAVLGQLLIGLSAASIAYCVL